jgi:hypothetical protein
MRTLALIRYLHEVILRKQYEQIKNKGQAFGYAGLDENGNIPLDQFPNVNDQVLLGRGDTGPGPVVEVTIGGGLSFTGNVLDAVGGGGAPANAEYLVAVADATLVNERVVSDTSQIAWDFSIPGLAGAGIVNNAVADTKLADMADSTLKGRGQGGGAGDPEAISLGTGLTMTGTVLSSTGGGGAPTGAEYLVGAADAGLSAERVVTDTPTVAWDLATAGQAKAAVPNDSITGAKLANMAASTVKGRGSAGGTGDPEDLTLGAGLAITGTVLDVVASGGAPSSAGYIVDALHAGLSAERALADTATVAWDFTTPSAASANVPNDAITDAKLANMAASTLKGRGAASGTGDPEAITLGANLSMTGTVLSATSGSSGLSAAEVAGRVAMRS